MSDQDNQSGAMSGHDMDNDRSAAFDPVDVGGDTSSIPNPQNLGLTDHERVQRRAWMEERKKYKKDTKFHTGRQYNLYHQWYWYPEMHKDDPRWWLLRSGLPFPSYHSNPTRNFPPRVTVIEDTKDPCEEIRAPRIRLAPDELGEKKFFLSAVQRKGEESQRPPVISTLNLSYQNLGEEYQYEQLLSFLKINKGVRVLALTDNFLTDLHGIELPYVEELFLARNNILSFKDLPAFPNMKRLSIEENFLTNTEGLNPQKYPKLTRLTLRSNPLAENKDYRRRVKRACPNVILLDNTPLLED